MARGKKNEPVLRFDLCRKGIDHIFYACLVGFIIDQKFKMDIGGRIDRRRLATQLLFDIAGVFGRAIDTMRLWFN